jgi:hypothetical protein
MGDLAPVSSSLPLPADLLRVRHGGRRALRRSARRLDGFRSRSALPSIFSQRLRPGCEAAVVRKTVMQNSAQLQLGPMQLGPMQVGPMQLGQMLV